ncbi:hypothetical protein TCAL_15672 [Tigriopus californicus]|uniref:Transposase Tc1-like domain-containing protein n=1 Tax=Tigriopus californicus TaxID=6832 RepID=A0A553PA69_TIGCA|nr:hypothetical protein TCAL_15672 [Tigriopus californicus]
MPKPQGHKNTPGRHCTGLNGGKGIGRNPCGPHRAKKRTPTFLAGLNRSIQANPVVWMTVYEGRSSLSRRTVARTVEEDLKLKSYIRRRSHLLTKTMKETRIKRGKKLHRLCNVNPGIIKLFSDESNSIVDPQNERWISGDKSNVPPALKTKFPSKIMAFGLVTSDGKVMDSRSTPMSMWTYWVVFCYLG